MGRRSRRVAEQRQAIEEFADGLELITPSDLRVIRIALDDRIVRHGLDPAGIAAQKVADKIDRNMIR